MTIHSNVDLTYRSLLPFKLLIIPYSRRYTTRAQAHTYSNSDSVGALIDPLANPTCLHLYSFGAFTRDHSNTRFEISSEAAATSLMRRLNSPGRGGISPLFWLSFAHSLISSIRVCHRSFRHGLPFKSEKTIYEHIEKNPAELGVAENEWSENTR